MRSRERAARLAPDARRAQLLATAFTVFGRKGLRNARLTDLARAAGVALPTVLHYFPSREALLAEMLREVSRFLLEDLLAGSASTIESAPAAIEDILLRFRDAIDSHPDHIRLWLEWSVGVQDERWPDYLAFHAGALDGIEGLLARGRAAGEVDPTLSLADAARVVVSLAHMIVQMTFAGGSREQVAHTVRSLVRGYLLPPPGT